MIASMLRFSAIACALLFLATFGVAQTYTPRHIRVDAPEGVTQSDVLHTAGLAEGVPLTKQQIEDGLGRLAATGDFTDLSYTVNADVLVLKLTGASVAKPLPVRYGNLVWWPNDQITALIQARVPLYHGELPQTGDLTDRVEAAVTAMLKEKGIDATVTILESMKADSISLYISRPLILVGDVKVNGALPALSKLSQQMQTGLAGQDFDLSVTSRSIPLNVNDLYENSGFLDATTDPATFSPPRKVNDHYVIDAATTVHPGEMYRIHRLAFVGSSMVPQAELEKAAVIKVGDPAGVSNMQHAADAVAFVYKRHWYQDATAQQSCPKDPSTHTVDCTFTVTSGELYHFAGVDSTAIPSDVSSAFARNFKLKSGTYSSESVMAEVFATLAGTDPKHSVAVTERFDKATHAATIVLKPAPRPQ